MCKNSRPAITPVCVKVSRMIGINIRLFSSICIMCVIGCTHVCYYQKYDVILFKTRNVTKHLLPLCLVFPTLDPFSNLHTHKPCHNDNYRPLKACVMQYITALLTISFVRLLHCPLVTLMRHQFKETTDTN